MTSQPVEANVVLSTDNSQYDQAMLNSAGSTDNLGRSVDTLGVKINNLSKVAGKSLIGISAADVALITGATAAWASYEKQVSLLAAQSAVLTRSQAQQTVVMKNYTTAVKELRTTYGTTTAEAATLIQTLSKITSIRQSAGLKDLSKVFVDMSNATGESSQGLASSLTNLQRVMGTPINAKSTRQYADQFTYLAAQTQTSAQNLIDFTTQLAPMGRSVHMTQSQVTGFATAFAKAGQDGIGVSSVFAKVTSDISKSIATGSPEVAHYANLIGVTNKQFKSMDGAEQFVRILETIGGMGRRGATELERLGLDGTRSMRSITAVLNQPGGLREALGLSEQGAKSNAAATGGKSATANLTHELGQLREETKLTAEAMGSYFAPVVEKFVTGMTFAAKIVREITEGPMGKFLGLVMGIVAPLAAGAGALLLFAGTLMKVAAAFTVLRSSAAYGVREGFQGGPGIVRGPDGFIASGEHAMLGARGAEIAQRGTWFQRGQYNLGQVGGGALASITAGMRSSAASARGFVDPGYQPGPARGLLSYAAGGIGRGLQLVNPVFDQMRFQDATKRSQYLQQVAPWARASDQARLSEQMGAVGLAQGQVGAVAKAQQAVAEDPLLTNAARAAKLEELKVIQQETNARLINSRAAETATRESIAATQIQTKEVSNSSVGFRRMAEGAGGFVAGAGGGLYGGAKAGIGALARSPMGMPLAGMAGMAAVSATGVQSNMLMGGAMGAMMGLPGAAIGAGVGALLDLTQSNKKVEASIASLKEQTDQAVKSGSGLSDWYDSMTKVQDQLNQTTESRSASNMWQKPENFFGAIWNFGNRNTGGGGPQARDQAAIDEERVRGANLQAVARELGARTGTRFTGTARNQRRQIDAFMSGSGAAMMADAGIDPEDLAAARQDMIAGGVPARNRYNRMLSKISTGGAQMRERSSGTLTGDIMLDSESAKRAIAKQGNVGLLSKAVDDMFAAALARGKDYQQVLQSTVHTQAKIGDENLRQYDLQAGLQAKVQTALQYQLPLMSRAQGFQSTISTQESIQAGIMSTPVSQMTNKAKTDLEASRTAVRDAVMGQVSQVQQALLMQDQYELQRSRAQDAYNLQRGYQEHDYQLQRSRAEDSFNRQRKWSVVDYHRSVTRSMHDYNLQRTRQEADFNHSAQVQAKQTAMSAMDIYHRVPTMRTSSASWLLTNAGDQLQRLREMEKNLNKLRSLGFSDSVIQQLRLTDPNNAQQLSRFVAEVSDDPKIMRQFNRAVGQRVGAAKDINTDQSNLEWKELRRGFNLQRQRGQEDFNRAQELGRADFNRGLGRQRKEFGIAMDQQATDFHTQMNRQETQYHTTMRNAAEDLALMGKEVNGSIEEILTRGATELTGNMQRQAAAALTTFTDLKKSTRPVAIAIMKDLSEIFGFEYKVPKLTSNNVTPPTGPKHGGSQLGAADGRIFPGYTPGRDVMTAHVSGGEAVMRPEWVRAVGHETVNALNHQAKYGGFASGGVVNPDGRVYMDGEPVSRITKAQLLLAEKLSGINLGTIQGSWQPWSTYSGSSHMGPGVVDESPGNFRTQYWLRRVGFAAWGRNFPGAASAGSGAHVHAVSLLDPGSAHQSQIAAYYAGQDGLGGRDYGPNPGLLPGLMGLLSQFSDLVLASNAPGGPSTALPRLSSILKHRYPHAEASAAAMQGVHPLFPGDISKVINKMARTRYAESLEGVNPNQKHTKWHGDGGVFMGPQGIGVGESGPEAVIPLNDQGAHFLAMAIHGAEARGIGMGSSPMHGGMSVYNTRIDKSTNFTGPITVQANDPAELMHKLQARQRVMALSRPSLTGSAA